MTGWKASGEPDSEAASRRGEPSGPVHRLCPETPAGNQTDVDGRDGVPPPGRPWRPGRLQTRFLMVTSLTLVVVSGTIVLLFHRLSVDAVERSRFQAASDVAASLALRLARGLPEPPVLERVLSEYVHDNSEIVAVAVFLAPERESRAGMHIRGRRELDEARETAASVSRVVEQDGERLWSVAVPIVRDGRTAGAVGVWSSLRAAELLTRESRRLAIILVPASILILVVTMSALFRREVHRPLEALGSAMLRAESDDPDAMAPVVKNDEIGFIAERYNRMLDHIRQGRDERETLVVELRDFNEKLARRVENATAELEERNSRLQKLNRELYQLQQRLIRIERESVAKHVAARVAHKIGTPLNLISGHVQLLKRSRKGDAGLQEKLGIVETQIEKLTSTVRELLDETRKSSFEMKPIDLRDLLGNIRALLEPILAGRGVSMELRLGSEPVAVDGDEARLEQVFLTLINNSLDAMPEGGRIRLSAETTESSTEVRLSDDGIGIPEALLPNIFEPFFTTKERGRGTGLGLSIVTEILSAHRAEIRAESNEGRGTTFILEFPRAAPPEAS